MEELRATINEEQLKALMIATYYLDEDNNVRPSDKLNYKYKHLWTTQTGKGRVSTVFSPTDLRGKTESIVAPLVFETKVFGGTGDGVEDSYRTYDDALHGHLTVCSRLEGGRRVIIATVTAEVIHNGFRMPQHTRALSWRYLGEQQAYEFKLESPNFKPVLEGSMIPRESVFHGSGMLYKDLIDPPEPKLAGRPKRRIVLE